MTRQQAADQADQEVGSKGFLHLMGLHRESEVTMGKDSSDSTSSFPEPEASFGGWIDPASI